ncbi:prenyltransferase/squalene oxidase repeat-containing protein [Aeoliella mucimassa]|uniref:Geranylgeranyl transferase type II subunit beta n=1 Tax=Aeoliella mucimassa TaxID=2527972 RepID=A0A518AJK9_9BACT|nr:prenyltransferase/squalene oxidase repeat-containing protein [Aeoliella mucimassa]QDU54927.1 Prenyltransferase and squalene oxidase repeat protein [Aeoliella mucimassa]
MRYVFVLLAIIASLPDKPAAIEFLQQKQTECGGFISFPTPEGEEPKPTLRTTRTGLRGLRLLGGKPADREGVIEFLNACYREDVGGFAANPEAEADPISTSVGLMILGELKLPNDKYVERGMAFMNEHTEGFEQIRMVASSLDELEYTVPNIDKWLAVIDKARNDDGSFGEGPGVARSTALYGVAEMRLGREVDKERILEILDSGRRTDGGWGSDEPGPSDLESCYRVVRLYRRLDAQPRDADKLRAFIASCKNNDGGYGRTPDEVSSLHGTYYSAIITYWLDGGK